MSLRELPFAGDVTLGALKAKLFPKTGTDPANMILTIKGGDGRALAGDGSTLEELGLSAANCDLVHARARD